MKIVWIPEWLGRPYAILYSTFKARKFSFQEAKDVLKAKRSTLLKIMSELSKTGFLAADKGEKRYQLSNFSSICDGIKAREAYKSLDLEEKLHKASKEYEKPYLIMGSYAAFLYHQYQFPVHQIVQVKPRDYGFWIQLLFDENVEVKPELKPTFEKVKLDKLLVEPPEQVVVHCLQKSSLTSTLDVLGVLVSETGRRCLNWNRLKQLAIKHKVVNELGALLKLLNDTLEEELGKRLFSDKYINELLTHIINKGRKKEFPKNMLKKRITLAEVGEQWRLKFYLPNYTLDKVIEDVALPALG